MRKSLATINTALNAFPLHDRIPMPCSQLSHIHVKAPRLASIRGSAIALLLAAATLSHPQSATAQAAYGSYVGVGTSIGFGDDTEVAGVIAFRYNILELPISLRAQAFIGDGFAFAPTVSYDIPLNWQTDVYVGAGVSFAGNNSVLGDQTAFAIQSGVDHMLPDNNLAIFGNAIVAFDAFRDRNTAAVSLQGGVGLQF
jgi:hypothetical protein